MSVASGDKGQLDQKEIDALNAKGEALFKSKNGLKFNLFGSALVRGTEPPKLALDYFIEAGNHLMAAKCYEDPYLSAQPTQETEERYDIYQSDVHDVVGHRYEKGKDINFTEAARHYLLATKDPNQKVEAVDGLKALIKQNSVDALAAYGLYLISKGESRFSALKKYIIGGISSTLLSDPENAALLASVSKDKSLSSEERGILNPQSKLHQLLDLAAYYSPSTTKGKEYIHQSMQMMNAALRDSSYSAEFLFDACMKYIKVVYQCDLDQLKSVDSAEARANAQKLAKDPIMNTIADLVKYLPDSAEANAFMGYYLYHNKNLIPEKGLFSKLKQDYFAADYFSMAGNEAMVARCSREGLIVEGEPKHKTINTDIGGGRIESRVEIVGYQYRNTKAVSAQRRDAPPPPPSSSFQDSQGAAPSTDAAQSSANYHLPRHPIGKHS